MMRPQQREKLLHAIVFFVKNTNYCHKLKLFKLLYFLDFEIYRQTGRSTTGMEYFAWPMGPVPNRLVDDLKQQPKDLREAMTIHVAATDDPSGDRSLTVYPKLAFDPDCFTPRELKEMERLAEIYKDAPAKTMTAASHVRGQPWDRIYRAKPQALIPYIEAIDGHAGSITKEQAEEIDEETREVAALFG